MKNKHSYAIFNCGIVQINQPARFIDNDMLNLEYIEILSHPFDEKILPTNHNLITNNIDFQLIKDTIETAIKICTDNIINDDEAEQASITGAAAAAPPAAAAEIVGGATLTEDQNNRDHIEFENLLKLKSERNAIIQISKRIYGDIMRLFKFNKNIYLKHIDLNDDIDIFSLSKSQLIVEKNGSEWNGQDTDAEYFLNREEIYTQHTLFDILILYLSHHKLSKKDNENVWTLQKTLSNLAYPFKEIIFKKVGRNPDVPNYSFYQDGLTNVEKKQVTYGYGRYLNSNNIPTELTQNHADEFIQVILQKLQEQTGGRKRSRINNIPYILNK